jgi:hypothetical protein
MIVFGGSGGDFGLPMNNGGRYDPSTDTWQPTASTASVPTPRRAHAAVWTGASMLVSNGGDGDSYDPSTNTWQSLAADASVTSRQVPGSVFTGKEWILWGGTVSSGAPIASGGRYCACPDGILVFRDSDGDGYGAPGSATGACDGTAPAGYATNGLDCGDDDASVYPGAAETCNGRDDDCDEVVDGGVPAPSGSPALAHGGSAWSWSTIAGATGYDLVSGSLMELRATGGDFAASSPACLADDLAVLEATDEGDPLPGDAFWYLVRPVSACTGPASYDEGSASQSATRDPEITACP